MSRPVVARLPSFNPTSGPSKYDEALIGSTPLAIFHTTFSSIATASSIDSSHTLSTFQWATVSSATNMTLSVDTYYTNSNALGQVTVSNMLRTAYNPYDVVAVNSLSEFITTKDGIYNIKVNSNFTFDSDFIGGDSIEVGLFTNGNFVSRVGSYFQSYTSISSGSIVQISGEWTGPLTQETTISLIFTGIISNPNTVTVGAWTGSLGAQCVIARQATLIHVVPQ